MKKVKTRKYAGGYKTINTDPIATIVRSMDDPKYWILSYDNDGYSGIWGSKKECMNLIESIANSDDEFVPECVIKII